MAARRAKFACSVDATLLARVERLRAQTGESRSAVINRALLKLTQEHARSLRVRRYVQALTEQPETETEIKRASALARRVLASVAWKNK
jgi:metal-responsive CopG/Arc/MetJ family transcriptional regulator